MVNLRYFLWGILCCAILAGLFILVFNFLKDMRAARERLNDPGSQVVETGCGAIEYARVGKGAPVLVIHGAMGGFDNGLLLAKSLLDKNHEAVAVSRLGYLRSPLPVDASLDRQAKAFACLLETLGIRQTVVFAVSAGATSAIRFAARYPQLVSKLVLVSPAAPGAELAPTPPQAVFDVFLRSDFIYWFAVRFFRRPMFRMIGVPDSLSLTPEMEREASETLDATLPAAGRMDGMIFDSYQVRSEFYEEISETGKSGVQRIKSPTLVINALDDPLAIPENVRNLAQKIPQASLFVVPDGGHILLGRSSQIKNVITEFLKDDQK